MCVKPPLINNSGPTIGKSFLILKQILVHFLKLAVPVQEQAIHTPCCHLLLTELNMNDSPNCRFCQNWIVPQSG